MSPRKKVTAGQEAAAEVRAARGRRKLEKAKAALAAGALTFRAFLSSTDFFPMGAILSDAMWAIVDASDGRPDLVPDNLSRQLFNCPAAALPTKPPRVVGIGSGRRSGKTSALLAPKGVHLALTVPAPNMKDGEIARVAIVAPDMDAAAACLNYIKGIIAGSPVLRECVVSDEPIEDPEDVGTTVAVLLRRPDGKLVDIVVRAASRGGKTVRSRTLLALLMDEACFFYGDDGHTVTDQAIFDAAEAALEPGGQIWVASTPWIEGEGLLEALTEQNWLYGTQGKTGLVAARVSTRVLRPAWDPDEEIERSMRARPDGNLIADREIYAVPLPRGSRSYFFPADVEAALGTAPPSASPQAVGAGADYGHTSDPSGFASAARYPGGLFAALLVTEIQSSPDQKPSATYATFAQAARRYGVREIASDSQYKEAAREEYERHGVAFKNAAARDTLIDAGREVLRERRLALAGLPPSDQESLRRQFAAIIAMPTPGGGTKIVIPRATVKESGAGKSTTHCDGLIALLTALYQVGSGDPSLWAHEEERRAEAAATAAAGAAYTPPAGSSASIHRYRAGGKVSTGRLW